MITTSRLVFWYFIRVVYVCVLSEYADFKLDIVKILMLAQFLLDSNVRNGPILLVLIVCNFEDSIVEEAIWRLHDFVNWVHLVNVGDRTITIGVFVRWSVIWLITAIVRMVFGDPKYFQFKKFIVLLNVLEHGLSIDPLHTHYYFFELLILKNNTFLEIILISIHSLGELSGNNGFLELLKNPQQLFGYNLFSLFLLNKVLKVYE